MTLQDCIKLIAVSYLRTEHHLLDHLMDQIILVADRFIIILKIVEKKCI